jgi:hypothetical protein
MTLPSPLSLCCPPPNSPTLCPPPLSFCLVVHQHITLPCLLPDCSALSATPSSHVFHCSLMLCCLPPARLHLCCPSPPLVMFFNACLPLTLSTTICLLHSFSLCPCHLAAFSSSSITAAIEHHCTDELAIKEANILSQLKYHVCPLQSQPESLPWWF